MATQPQAATGAEPDETVEQKIQQLRELFADAPEVGRTALENVLAELTSQSESPPPAVESAGRAGIRLGNVSEAGDHHRPVRTRWCPATAGVSAVAGR
jgi:hypothetical protein